MPDALQKPAAPTLRFPEFKGDWKPSRAGDAFRNSRTKGEAGLPIYSVTMDRGLVPRDTLDRHLASDAEDGVNLRAQKGDLVYNMMRMWQGAVGLADKECMVSPAYVVLAPKKGASSEFFNFWFQSPRMLYLLWAYSHGLTNDRLRLYFDDFAQIPIHLPTSEEQKKIAAFLLAIDAKLEALRRKRLALNRYKAGLMQRLFSKTLRFTRADGTAFPDWEAKEFGQLYDFIATNSLSRDALSYSEGEIQNIHYGDIHSRFRSQFRQEQEQIPFIRPDFMLDSFNESQFCRVGDIVIADASEDYADIGKAIEIISVRENSLVAGLHTFIARPKSNEIVVGYSGYLFQTFAMRRQIMRIAQGISVLGISKPKLAKLNVPLPHPDEQRKIADALAAIDAKIQAVIGQISTMEAFKKSLLQKMFV